MEIIESAGRAPSGGFEHPKPPPLGTPLYVATFFFPRWHSLGSSVKYFSENQRQKRGTEAG